MKVVILAGGRGERLGVTLDDRPKALVEFGGAPVIEHVMSIYARSGFRDFIVATGFRGDRLREHFRHRSASGRDDAVWRADWTVACVDTGDSVQTGGRLKRLADRLGDGTFMLTWTDGVGDIDIAALLAFHRQHGKLATVTAVRPPARFGHLSLERDQVTAFEEKPEEREGWINGAFFVLEPGVLDMIEGDATSFERGPLTELARCGELMAFRHHGFWQCMDTPADIERLEAYAACAERPWARGAA